MESFPVVFLHRSLCALWSANKKKTPLTPPRPLQQYHARAAGRRAN